MKMSKEDAKLYIKNQMKDYANEYLDWGGIGFISCPNPNHHDITPSCHVYPDHLCCYSCTNSSKDGENGCKYDIFDCIAWEYDLKNFSATFKKACELFDVEIIDEDGEPPQLDEDYLDETQRIFTDTTHLDCSNYVAPQLAVPLEVALEPTIVATPTVVPQEVFTIRFTTNQLINAGIGTIFEAPEFTIEEQQTLINFIMEYETQKSWLYSEKTEEIKGETKSITVIDHRNMVKYMAPYATTVQYLYDRGLSENIIKQSKIVVTPQDKYIRGPAIVMSSPDGACIKALNPRAKLRYRAEGNFIPNTEFILERSPDLLFVLESALDSYALESIFDELDITNFVAIAMCSTKRVKQIVTLFQDYYEVTNALDNATVVLCLDNDNAGRAASQSLYKQLNAMKFSVLEFNLSSNFKDIGDFIQAHGTDSLKTFFATPNLSLWFKQEALSAAADKNKTSTLLKKYKADSTKKTKTSSLSTGYPELDKALPEFDAGTLTMLGAEASVGKSGFFIDLALHFVAQGRNVIFITLEMSKTSVLSRILTYISHSVNPNMNLNSSDFAYADADLTAEQRQHREFCYDALEKLGDNLVLVDSSEIKSVFDVEDYIAKFVLANPSSKPPIIFLDYCQLLQNPSKHRPSESSKSSGNGLQEIDNIGVTVTSLVGIKNQYNTPIFAIAAVNRGSYGNSGPKLDAFRGNSLIEFSADIAIMLCFESQKFGKDVFDPQKEKQSNPRKIQLDVVKYKESETGSRVIFDYYPNYNYFQAVKYQSPGEAAECQMIVERSKLMPGVIPVVEVSPLVKLLNKNPLFIAPNPTGNNLEGGDAQ